jgi:thiaminase/transcriptional activator TenA
MSGSGQRLTGAESFCDSLRADCGSLWEGLHQHPFLRELAAGTLAPERFRFFLEQDIFFLPELARAVGLGLAKAESERELAHFAEEVEAVVGRELESNRRLLARVLELGAGDRGGLRAAAPATVAYAGFLVSTAGCGGTLEIMAALLPCTWSYADIATRLKEEIAPHPVYTAWVGFFASDAYGELIAGRRQTLDDLAAGAGEVRKRRLSHVFTMSTRLEHAFWDMAYRCEQWPDLGDD